jgi:hypothetical protein
VGKKKTAGRCIVSAPHAHQRTTDSGKRGGGASQVEGGSGDRGGRRLPGGSKWPGGPNATWAGAEKTEKQKKEMGRKDDWAEMVFGCAEKKKKKSFQILIQGIIFKFKF